MFFGGCARRLRIFGICSYCNVSKPTKSCPNWKNIYRRFPVTKYSTVHNSPLPATITASTLNKIKSVDVFHSSSASEPIIDLDTYKPPSVTKILSVTKSEEDKLVLERWKQKMIGKLGASGFEEYQQGLFRRGHALHSNIESHLLCKEYEVNSEVTEYMKSVRPQLDNFHDVLACEHRLRHDSLGYTGIIDCVAHHCSTGLFVIDWKTSERKKTTLIQTYDQPLQIAAYIGVWNNQNPDDQISQGMLVMIYPDGVECNVIKISNRVLGMYWQEWKSRLKLYWEIQESLITESLE